MPRAGERNPMNTRMNTRNPPMPGSDEPGSEELWSVVMSRDPSFDGRFVYAVRTTGVYCRPSCSSRRPRPEHVRYFHLPEEARKAGIEPVSAAFPTGS